MAETFYSFLGVDSGADGEDIDRAYRHLATDLHPDVNDSPDASRQFQRLKIARDVLENPTERRRYHRLGHDRYVSEHVDSDAWTAKDTGEPAPAGGTTGPSTPDVDRSGFADSPRAEPATRTNRTASTDSSWTCTGTGGAGTRTDGGYVRTGQSSSERPDTGVTACLASLNAAVPWLVVYFAVLVTAVPTVWFAYSEGLAGLYVSLPLAALAGLGLLIFHVEARLLSDSG